MSLLLAVTVVHGSAQNTCFRNLNGVLRALPPCLTRPGLDSAHMDVLKQLYPTPSRTATRVIQMAPVVLSTTRSTLMHACLAYLSPELQAFDSIVRLHSQLALRVNPPPCNPSRKTILSIPPELLLAIRVHLLPLIANQLYARSASALLQYESSLRALLCAECIAYNEDIFGGNVWDWDHFSSPCACAEIQNGSRKPVQKDAPVHEICPLVHPKRFTNPHRWLESHLCSEYLRLPSRSRSPIATDITLWDVVSNVLGEFGCEVLRSNAADTSLLQNKHSQTTSDDVGFMSCRSRQIFVVPLPTARRHETREVEIEDDRRRIVILKRVERELGLSFEHKDAAKVEGTLLGAHVSPASSPPSADTTLTRRHFGRSTSMSQNTVFVLLQSFTGLLTACICFPFTFLTIFVTVLYYYCRPGTLRVM